MRAIAGEAAYWLGRAWFAATALLDRALGAFPRRWDGQ